MVRKVYWRFHLITQFTGEGSRGEKMLQLAPKAASHRLALAAALCWGLEAEYLIAGLWRTDSIKTFSPFVLRCSCRRISCYTETTMAPVTQRAKERTFIQEEAVPRVPGKQG